MCTICCPSVLRQKGKFSFTKNSCLTVYLGFIDTDKKIFFQINKFELKDQHSAFNFNLKKKVLGNLGNSW